VVIPKKWGKLPLAFFDYEPDGRLDLAWSILDSIPLPCSSATGSDYCAPKTIHVGNGCSINVTPARTQGREADSRLRVWR